MFVCFVFFFFKQKTAYEIGTGDWSSDVCSSDLPLSLRGEMLDDTKLVGDGPFFVGRVLDSLSAKDSKYASAIEKAYKDLMPKSSADRKSVV